MDCGVTWTEKKNFRSLWGRGEVVATDCLFLKPQTYMNNSGAAVAAVVRYYKIEVMDVVVIHDDLDVSNGRVKARSGGSAGGHNGVQSVIDHLHSRDFHRIKLGVAKNKDAGTITGEAWVLSKFSPPELQALVVEMKEQVLLRLRQIFLKTGD